MIWLLMQVRFRRHQSIKIVVLIHLAKLKICLLFIVHGKLTVAQHVYTNLPVFRKIKSWSTTHVFRIIQYLEM